MRKHLTVLAFPAIVGVILLGCSDDGEANAPQTDPETTTTLERGIEDSEAEARSAAVRFFEAQAVLDYEVALESSSGAAATGVRWARAVNGIDQASGTPYAVEPTRTVSTTVSIDQVSESADGLYRANGYIQLDQYPGWLSPGPVEGIEGETPSGWFATDLVFTLDGDRLRVDDYRMDDSPYPVSQLVSSFDDADDETGTETGTDADGADETDANETDAEDAGARAVVVLQDPAPSTTQPDGSEPADEVDEQDRNGDDPTALAHSIELRLGHQDLDGSVQYELTHGHTDLVLSAAEFIGTDQAPADVPVDAPGSPMELFTQSPPEDDTDPDPDAADTSAGDPAGADEDDGSAEEPFLVVAPDGFPGAQGILRLTFANAEAAPDQLVVIHLAVPSMPTPTEQATNDIRRLLTSTTTTTTTTTAPPPVLVPVPVPEPGSDATTTAPPADSTTTPSNPPSTTTTTSAG